MQDKIPYNKQGQAHGRWEKYYPNTDIAFKGNYINGERYGSRIWYDVEGEIELNDYYAR
jgi:antitoxin component YwqK of YwqJK toxin-antitoxin module